MLSEEDIRSRALAWSAIQRKFRARAPSTDAAATDSLNVEADQIESELAAVGLDVRSLVGNISIID